MFQQLNSTEKYQTKRSSLSEIHAILANAYLLDGNYHMAINQANIAISISRGQEWYYVILILAYQKDGKTFKSDLECQKALSNFPNWINLSDTCKNGNSYE